MGGRWGGVPLPAQVPHLPLFFSFPFPPELRSSCPRCGPPAVPRLDCPFSQFPSLPFSDINPTPSPVGREHLGDPPSPWQQQ